MRKVQKKAMILALISSLCLIAPTGTFCGDILLFGNPEPIQGEIFPVKILSDELIDGVEIRFRKDRIHLRNSGRRAEGIFGFDLEEPPGLKRVEFILRGKNGVRKKVKSVKLLPAHFPTQYLSGIDDFYVNPGEKNLERIKGESRLLKKIWRSSTPEVLWEGNFIPPYDGFNGHGFGRKRVINGEHRNPHTGVDSDADRGTPVVAINNGSVRLAKELFFSGISAIIDHGGGLFSMYFHLQNVTVTEGDHVKKGDIIGHVGSTGRATGPHLHLGVRLESQRVNPMDLFR